VETLLQTPGCFRQSSCLSRSTLDRIRLSLSWSSIDTVLVHANVGSKVAPPSQITSGLSVGIHAFEIAQHGIKSNCSRRQPAANFWFRQDERKCQDSTFLKTLSVVTTARLNPISLFESPTSHGKLRRPQTKARHVYLARQSPRLSRREFCRRQRRC
jgi:hypothetical protein